MMFQTPKPSSTAGGQCAPAGGLCKRLTAAPQQGQAPEPDQIHQHVEQPVGQALGADIPQHRAVDQAQQVMPLQHLMQQDAVKKSAQCDADQIAGPPEAAWRQGGRNCACNFRHDTSDRERRQKIKPSLPSD
jgi:hypothetical protein